MKKFTVEFENSEDWEKEGLLFLPPPFEGWDIQCQLLKKVYCGTQVT